MCLDLVVQIDHMQDVKKLTFVLMKSLNLDIEDRVRVNLNTIVLQDIFCKTLFVLELDGHELLKSLLIVCVNFKLGSWERSVIQSGPILSVTQSARSGFP